MQPNKRNRKVVRILLIILVISSIVAAGIGIAQVMPDRSSDNMEPYSAEWTLPSSVGDEIEVKVSASHITISQHAGNDVKVSFVGKRKAYRDDDMPEIIATSENGLLCIKERRYQKKVINIGFEDHDHIEGILTIALPATLFDDVRIEGFSGDISIENLSGETIKISTSSGNIKVAGITATGSTTLSGFSGAIVADTIVSPSLTLDTSSGCILAKNLTIGQNLTVKSFSGKQDLQQISAGNALVDTSSGDVVIHKLTAKTLDGTTFSGKAEIKQSDIENAAMLKTSSGDIHINTFGASRLSLETFSGDAAIDGVTTGELQATTSSGAIKASLLSGCPITAETFSGDVSLTLPPDIGFKYKIDTFNGDVNIGFAQITTDQKSGGAASGTIGDGAFDFDLKTSSGGISIQPQEI